MDNIISYINEIYSEILNSKQFLKEQSNNIHLFGGANCKWRGGPQNHATLGQNIWTSKNAWDLEGVQGTKVYSIDNGTVTNVTLKPYDKKLSQYGYSIEIKSSDDKIYYTHLSSVGPKIKQGQNIVQGDLIGSIGKPQEDPEWPSHVHIALEKGDISKLLDSSCNIIVKKGNQSSNTTTGTTSGTTTGDNEYFYNNKGIADLVLGKDYQFESLKNKKTLINEVTMLAPVPIKSGFKGNFAQNRGGYIHPGTDIPVPSGTPVKAPLSGKVVNVNSNAPKCGGTIDIEYSDGFWSRFCHIKQINVKKGDLVNRGDVVGLSGGGINDYGRGRSDGPHLHFTLKKDGKKVDPANYMEKINVSDITYDTNKTNTDNSSSNSDGDNQNSSLNLDLDGNVVPGVGSESGYFYGNKEWAQQLSKSLDVKLENRIKEEKVYDTFGKNPQSRYGTITLPKEKNDRIKSPVSGVISRGKLNSACKNQINIYHEVDKVFFTLEYCGISKPSVRLNQNVSKGTVLGTTTEDVVISLFDDSGSRVYIDSYIKKEIDKTKKLNSKGIKNEPKLYYNNAWGRIIGDLISTPIQWFEDKYDENGQLKQKRWSSPTDKIQPDDWMSKGSPTYSKKVNENIKRIKKIL